MRKLKTPYTEIFFIETLYFFEIEGLVVSNKEVILYWVIREAKR